MQKVFEDSKQQIIHPDSLGPFENSSRFPIDPHQHLPALNSGLPSHLPSHLGPFLAFSMVNLLSLPNSLLPLLLPPPLFPKDAISCLCYGIGYYNSLLTCSYPSLEWDLPESKEFCVIYTFLYFQGLDECLVCFRSSINIC